jgi:hypothetical protein
MFVLDVYGVTAVAFVMALWMGLYIKERRYQAHLCRLGSRPRQVKHFIPFGFDLLWENIKVSLPFERNYLILAGKQFKFKL